jgi:4-hydroxybenzoate polyprenyltransferase
MEVGPGDSVAAHAIVLERVAGLARACHPAPTVAVTAVTTLLTVAAGADTRSAVGAGLAIGLGQLSIGWSNDAHDADTDRSAGRLDKPIVSGETTRRSVWTAAFVALAVTAVASLLVGGAIGGLAHLVAVLAGWAYNLGISRTAWSFAPYIVCFGLFPVFIVRVADPTGAPTVWAVAAFAAVAAGAHLVNGLRDLDIDRATGLGGAVVRLGASRARVLAAVAFGGAGVAVAVGARQAGPALRVLLPAAVVAALVPGLWLIGPRQSFRWLLIAVVAVVVLLVAAILSGDLSLLA